MQEAYSVASCFLYIMVILHLRNIEAKELKPRLKKIADNIEIEAIKENRPTNTSEDLVIMALSQIYAQTERQLKRIPNMVIEQAQAEHNKQYKVVIERQAKQN